MVDYKDVEPLLRGMWPEIFASIGIKMPRFKNKNGPNMPCPICGVGVDRAHWRDVDGRIALYCRVCAPDSMWSPESVYMKLTGISFPEFCDDMKNFINFIPIDTRAKIKHTRITKSEPTYCASLTEDECASYIDENKNFELVPIQKRINGKLTMCNVAKITECGIEYAAGSWSHKGFAIIGNGRIDVATPSYKFAKWYADKFECGVIWAINPENLRDMLADSKRDVRIVMEWDFDAMCEIEKGNAGQSIELIDMKTGLTAALDCVERLLDIGFCGDVAPQQGA